MSFGREQNGNHTNQPNMVTRIIKIGGASITDKSQFECVKLAHIEFIVEQLKTNYQKLILIHGAGSFGYVNPSHLDR